MNYAIILAGGTGTRFWPLSRQNSPKQFLNIFSNRSPVEETIRRVGNLIPRRNIYIATNEIYYKKIKQVLRELNIPGTNLLLEPKGKNTLAPIGVLSAKIYGKDKDSLIISLPSDHYIKDRNGFLNILGKGLAAAKRGFIITLGIKPGWPETGYGYIKARQDKLTQGAYKVDRFIEKPALLKAKSFIRANKYYWNSGIFIFSAVTLLNEINRLAPKAYNVVTKISTGVGGIKKLWNSLPSVSIDYGIMEKTNRMLVMPADFGWSDLGSWRSLELFVKKDSRGNIFKGNCIDLNSKNIIAWSDNRLLATVGLDNIIVADTKDAILVCSKEKAQDVREIVRILKQKGLYKQI